MRKAVIFATFAIVALIQSAYAIVDSFVRFVFSAVSPQPAFAFAGRSEGFGGFFPPTADPHVQRHEAGQSRRAAARGI